MSDTFLDERQRALNKFLWRLAVHPFFSYDDSFKVFVTAETEVWLHARNFIYTCTHTHTHARTHAHTRVHVVVCAEEKNRNLSLLGGKNFRKIQNLRSSKCTVFSVSILSHLLVT